MKIRQHAEDIAHHRPLTVVGLAAFFMVIALVGGVADLVRLIQALAKC